MWVKYSFFVGKFSSFSTYRSLKLNYTKFLFNNNLHKYIISEWNLVNPLTLGSWPCLFTLMYMHFFIQFSFTFLSKWPQFQPTYSSSEHSSSFIVYCIFSCKFATCCIPFAFVRMRIIKPLLTYSLPIASMPILPLNSSLVFFSLKEVPHIHLTTIRISVLSSVDSCGMPLLNRPCLSSIYHAALDTIPRTLGHQNQIIASTAVHLTPL